MPTCVYGREEEIPLLVLGEIKSRLSGLRPLVFGVCSNAALETFDKDLKRISVSYDLSLETFAELEAFFSAKGLGQKASDASENDGLDFDQRLRKLRHDFLSHLGALRGYADLIADELSTPTSTVPPEILKLMAESDIIFPLVQELKPRELQIENEPEDKVFFGFDESDLRYEYQGQTPTVLIVDDSEYNRDILTRRLSSLGLQVLTAENGIEGLEVLEQEKIDLILLDILMPRLNGYEVLNRLKQDSKTADIPVLMISAITETNSIVKCIEAGADDYLPTPLNPTILSARVRSCLDKKILKDQEAVHLARLAQTQNHLKIAIEHMDEGIALFNKDKQIALYNQKFLNIYPSLTATLGTSIHLEDFLRGNLEHGIYVGSRRSTDEKGAVNQRQNMQDDLNLRLSRYLAGKPFMEQLKDGRWIEVLNSPTPDGGFVSLQRDVTEMKKSHDRMKFLANHDPLTGLGNRAAFEDYFHKKLAQAKAQKKGLHVLYMDLDGFKKINDTLGHDRGDLLLISVAKTLSSVVRDTDFAARLGGDEFVVVFDNLQSRQDLVLIMNRIMEGVGHSLEHEHKGLTYGLSIGVSSYPEDGVEATELLNYADEAMYHAKKSGKGCYRFYQDLKSA